MYFAVPFITELQVANKIIQAQANLATIGICVLAAIAGLLVAGTWFTNFYFNRKKLEDAIKSFSEQILSREEKSINSLRETVKEEVATMKQEVEENTANKMMEFEAEKARLFALFNYQNKNYRNAVGWWATAARCYSEIGVGEMTRTSTEQILRSLKLCTYLDDRRQENIRNNLTNLPSILKQEIDEISELLESLPSKKPKTSG